MDAQHASDDAAAEAGTETVARGLPAWVYRDETFHRLEHQRVLLPAWQVVCHVNDIPEPGDYRLLDFLARPIVVLRGNDGQVNAFYNLCRHRAARLLDGDGDGWSGRCERGRIVCPYHAWSYDCLLYTSDAADDRT